MQALKQPPGLKQMRGVRVVLNAEKAEQRRFGQVDIAGLLQPEVDEIMLADIGQGHGGAHLKVRQAGGEKADAVGRGANLIHGLAKPQEMLGNHGRLGQDRLGGLKGGAGEVLPLPAGGGKQDDRRRAGGAEPLQRGKRVCRGKPLGVVRAAVGVAVNQRRVARGLVRNVRRQVQPGDVIDVVLAGKQGDFGRVAQPLGGDGHVLDARAKAHERLPVEGVEKQGVAGAPEIKINGILLQPQPPGLRIQRGTGQRARKGDGLVNAQLPTAPLLPGVERIALLKAGEAAAIRRAIQKPRRRERGDGGPANSHEKHEVSTACGHLRFPATWLLLFVQQGGNAR